MPLDPEHIPFNGDNPEGQLLHLMYIPLCNVLYCLYCIRRIANVIEEADEQQQRLDTLYFAKRYLLGLIASLIGVYTWFQCTNLTGWLVIDILLGMTLHDWCITLVYHGLMYVHRLTFNIDGIWSKSWAEIEKDFWFRLGRNFAWIGGVYSFARGSYIRW